MWSCGVVVITSALHAEGHEFDPHQDLNLWMCGSNLIFSRNHVRHIYPGSKEIFNDMSLVLPQKAPDDVILTLIELTGL